MLAFVLDQINGQRVTEQTIVFLGLPEVVPSALGVEVVARATANQSGARSSHENVIGMVHAVGDLPEDILFRILWPYRSYQLTKSGQVACRGGKPHSFVQSHDVTGQGAAAGATGATDLGPVYVLATRQVVDSPHAVPNPISRRVCSQQNRAGTDQEVLGDRRQLATLGGKYLAAFTLPDRIVTKGRNAVTGQSDSYELVVVRALSGLAVTTRDQDRGIRGFGLWKV